MTNEATAATPATPAKAKRAKKAAPAAAAPRQRGPVIRYFYACPVTGCEEQTERQASQRGAEILLQRHVLNHATIKKVEVRREVTEVEVP